MKKECFRPVDSSVQKVDGVISHPVLLLIIHTSMVFNTMISRKEFCADKIYNSFAALLLSIDIFKAFVYILMTK